ncbi:acyloxyacyl hydrolase [Aureivirga marina]|uniref:acyloxyacyl hydrolase n=1 Tax=Aureivirga marina TaxID=1182451 RepID=UPI0018C90C5D|nr:acyloxyacyl hydrolase [Aureivirga marina]
MKKLTLFLIYLNCFFVFSQRSKLKSSKYFIDVSTYYGSIIKHKPSISHLTQNHPTGFIFSFNQRSIGKKEWERIYNYPDYGFTFYTQDYHNEKLGKLYAINGHYSFYLRHFKERNQVVLKVGTGLSYVTKPYDRYENKKNNIFGSHVNASIFFNLYYQRLLLIKNFGIKAGISIIHNSNGSSKSPNSGSNVFSTFVGINYSLGKKQKRSTRRLKSTIPKKERIKVNLLFLTGKNQSDVIGSDRYPFYHISLYADKRISKKSAFQAGFEYFNSKFLKEHIYYKSLSYYPDIPEKLPDYKRVSVIVGHELFINKVSAIVQLGYYIYSPFKIEGSIYENIGIKYYLTKHIYSQIQLKAHSAKAESFGFGLGIRI